MVGKIIKSLVVLSVAAILICVGVLAGGTFQEEYQQSLEEQTETTKRIAVVNLDEGIEVEGQKTYYAQNMVMLPNSNFVMTNLEDARSGIRQGIYAAYIIIPVSFSRSIESINGTPIRVSLEYELNKNLKASIKPEIVEQLHEFQIFLSENTTYVYVSAILREYHKAQDSSKIVMENGSTNIDAIKKISVDDLFVQLKNPELLSPDFARIDLDINTYLKNNSEISKLMDHKFKETLEMGQESFDYVKDAHSEVEQETEKLTTYVSDMEISPDIYSSGLSELSRVIDTFNNNQNSKRNWVKAELASQSNATRAEGQQHVSRSLEEILEEIQSESDMTLVLLSNQIQSLVDQGIVDLQDDNQSVIRAELEYLQLLQEEAYVQIQEYVEIRLEEINQYYEEQANNWLIEFIENVKERLILPEDSDEEDLDEVDIAVTSLLATFSNATIQLATSSDAWIDMEEGQVILPTLATADFALKNPVAAGAEEKDESSDFWLEIPFLSFLIPERTIELPPINTGSYDSTVDQLEEFYHISTEDVEQVLNDSVIGVIAEKVDENSLDLREIIEEFNNKTDDYQKSLDEYDPYEYIDMSFLSQAMYDIEKNLRDLETDVSGKSREQAVLVDDIYKITSDNTNELQNTMRVTYEESQDNVVRTVRELRNLQEKNYDQDTKLLTDFSRQLSYTRVGSIGNKSLYDFISNPVLLVSSDSAKASFFHFDSDYRKWTVIAITALAGVSGFLLAIYIIIKVLSKRRGRRNEL